MTFHPSIPDHFRKAVLSTSLESYLKRREFVTRFSWHVPTEELIALMREYSPLLSVCSGLAFTESLALAAGCDIICTDISTNPQENHYPSEESHPFMQVEEMELQEAIAKWSDRNLFLAWPPYDHPAAHLAVQALAPGRVLIYVGESEGGCTGNRDFFDYLHENFSLVTETGRVVAQWSGINDTVSIWRKNGF